MRRFVEYKRDGTSVWPYCIECGCRLNISDGGTICFLGEVTLIRHFGPFGNKDARGCTCSMVGEQTVVNSSKVAMFL